MSQDRIPIFAAMFCALFVSASAAQAAGGGRMFDRMDQDQDGLVTRDEIAQARARMFTRVDADGDGLLTRQEVEESAARRSAERANRRFDRLDEDQDGLVSQGEFMAKAGHWISRADIDGDGAISRDEWHEAKSRMREHKHQGDGQ